MAVVVVVVVVVVVALVVGVSIQKLKVVCSLGNMLF